MVLLWFCYFIFKQILYPQKKMPKTNLTLEDIEQIKKSKGNISASEMQRKYNIGWGRLQNLWNGKPVAQDAENIYIKKGGGGLHNLHSKI